MCSSAKPSVKISLHSAPQLYGPCYGYHVFGRGSDDGERTCCSVPLLPPRSWECCDQFQFDLLCGRLTRTICTCLAAWRSAEPVFLLSSGGFQSLAPVQEITIVGTCCTFHFRMTPDSCSVMFSEDIIFRGCKCTVVACASFPVLSPDPMPVFVWVPACCPRP